MDNDMQDKKYQPLPFNDAPPGVSPAIVGCAFLVSSCLSSFVAAYLAVQSSVDKYIESNKEIKILELKSRSDQDAKADDDLSKFRSELSELRDKLLFSGKLYEAKEEKPKIGKNEGVGIPKSLRKGSTIKEVH